MKLLKLDARYKDARRVARCLVGSEIDKHNNLCGVFDEWFFIACEEVRQSCTIQKIELPLDTLKFCPFVAMREGVFAHGKDSHFEYFGEIENLTSDEEYSMATIGSWSYYTKNEINLYLTPIERGELEGCEIVEVGE